MSKAQRETDRLNSEQEVSLGPDRIPRTAAEVGQFILDCSVYICSRAAGNALTRLWAQAILLRAYDEAARNPDPMLDKGAHNG